MGIAPERLVPAPTRSPPRVDRASETVERAPKVYGPSVYVRREIVPHSHAVARLRGVAVVGP